MKLVCISDTHGHHRKVDVPEGDILIHTGDVSVLGTRPDLYDFTRWFVKQPHKYKIFVPGNHDRCLEEEGLHVLDRWLDTPNLHVARGMEKPEILTIEGITFQCSSIQPVWGNWSFNRNEVFRENYWNNLTECDVLLTHCPPMGILDQTFTGKYIGDSFLTTRLETIIPKYHVFGHCHEAYGQTTIGDTTFINAALCNNMNQLCNQPIIIDY